MLESQIEAECVNWATNQGWLSYKFVSPNKRGVPDRMFLRAGKTVFVEFKRPGFKVSRLQQQQIDKIRSYDFKVFVISNLKGMEIAFTR